jgi:four helix bundle protein
MKRDNVVKDKSFAFAIRIVRLCKYLSAEKKEYDLSRQLIRSGTAIGALIREAEHGQSKADFIHKIEIAIALKEANETEYWLDLLFHTQIISEEEYKSIQPDISELNKLLISISKSAKTN